MSIKNWSLRLSRTSISAPLDVHLDERDRPGDVHAYEGLEVNPFDQDLYHFPPKGNALQVFQGVGAL
jgi:hypothetical protein